jgi:hypothetical protein
MKTLILILFTTVATAQHVQFFAGADIRNAVTGSAPTNNQPELDLLLRLDAIAESGLGVSLFYENFEAIEFSKWGIGLKQEFTLLDKLTLSYIVEPTVIKRDWGSYPLYDPYQFHQLINSNPNYTIYTEFTAQQLADAGVGIIAYQSNDVHYLSLGLSIPLAYQLTDWLLVELQYNALYRTDLKDRYNDNKIVNSLYLNVGYRF